MNKLLSIICCILLVCVCEAQTMQVWMRDGSQRQFAVSEIDSVTFSGKMRLVRRNGRWIRTE